MDVLQCGAIVRKWAEAAWPEWEGKQTVRLPVISLELRRSCAYPYLMEGMIQFNIRDEQGMLLCPACGYPGFSFNPAYFEHGGERIVICPCCMWEPGYDDDDASSATDVLNALRGYRKGWHGSALWASPNDPPPNWDGQRQLLHLFKVAPNVR
ncbi:hypothetical protein [Sphingomonas sp. R86520]|uniref:hypothetical protein n=1 Tax=Sphingomonas sp. R86520 TaxID=3093859 RepID=UPI0036D41990